VRELSWGGGGRWGGGGGDGEGPGVGLHYWTQDSKWSKEKVNDGLPRRTNDI
jgi:hypothetical protein